MVFNTVVLRDSEQKLLLIFLIENGIYHSINIEYSTSSMPLSGKVKDQITEWYKGLSQQIDGFILVHLSAK